MGTTGSLLPQFILFLGVGFQKGVVAGQDCRGVLEGIIDLGNVLPRGGRV